MRKETDRQLDDVSGVTPAADEYRWYIVFTMGSKRDKSVERSLKGLARNGYGDEIADVKMITCDEFVAGKNGKTRKVEKNVSPRYVYVKMRRDEALFYRVNHLDGVVRILGNGKPEPLSREEVFEIGLEDDPASARDVAVGDRVAFTRGTLKGYEGTVKEVNRATKKAKIAITLFGLETVAEADLADVKKAV